MSINSGCKFFTNKGDQCKLVDFAYLTGSLVVGFVSRIWNVLSIFISKHFIPIIETHGKLPTLPVRLVVVEFTA